MLYLQTPNPTMTEMQARKKGEMKIGEKLREDWQKILGERGEMTQPSMTPLPVTITI